jgi:hypothetical protein
MSRQRYSQTVQKTSRHFTKWKAIPARYIQSCCGCGLVHEWRFSWGKVKGKYVLGRRVRQHVAETKKERKRFTKRRQQEIFRENKLKELENEC